MSARKHPLDTRPSLFRRTDQGAPELESKEDIQASEHPEIEESKQHDGKNRTKRTYHLPDEVVLLLSELQLQEYRQTGRKPELSDLVADAIKQLAEERLSSTV
jgi:hypothetical protein